MSSLASQLKRLAVPQTSNLLHDFKRPSLLFDTKEAKSIDRDDIFSLGVSGLEELESLNIGFKSFRRTLFSESSKQMERSVHTEKVNVDLDRDIKRFLILLSPHFPLRPAHKALEWLIYRFHIEMYNIDDLVACILPFHETNIFVRVIQMLDLKSPTHRWNWLESIQKPGVPLAKATLFTHCYKDLGFLKFVCSLVPASLQIKGHSSDHVVINFYLTTIIGALEAADRPREEFVSILFPFLAAGVGSPNLDYVAATYMVTGQLVSKVHLNEKWLEKLIHLLLSKIDNSQKKEAISCICLLFQTQNIKAISKDTFLELSGISDLTELLNELSDKFSIDAFLKPFLSTLLEDEFNKAFNGDEESDKFIAVLTNVASEGVVCDLIEISIQKYKDMHKMAPTGKNQMCKKMGNLFDHVERKYPEQFDSAIKNIGEDDIVDEILAKMTPESSFHIHHPNSRLRNQATKHLVQQIENDQVIDTGNLPAVLLARINDESPEIVQTVLNLKEELFKIVEPSLVVAQISERIIQNKFSGKKRSQKIIGLYQKCLLFLMEWSTDEKLICRAFLALIPFFFCTSPSSYAQLVNLHSLDFSNAKIAFLNSIKKDEGDCLKEEENFKDNYQAYNIKMIKALKLWSEGLNYETKKQILEVLSESITSREDLSHHQSILYFLALAMLPNLSKSSVSLETMELTRHGFRFIDGLTAFKIHKLNVTLKTEELCLEFSKLKPNHFLYESIYLSILNVVLPIAVPAELKERKCWSIDSVEDESSSVYLLLMSEMFSTNTKLWRNKVFSQEFFQFSCEFYKDHFSNSSNMLKFLLMICHDVVISVDPSKTEADKTSIMNYSLNLLNSTLNAETDSSWIIGSSCCAVPSILALLTTKRQDWRKAILELLVKMLEKKSKSGYHIYLSLISFLTEHKEELINDERCLPQLIQQFHETMIRESPRKGKKIKKSNALTTIFDMIVDDDIGDSLKSSLIDCLGLLSSSAILQNTIPCLSAFFKSIDQSISSPSKYSVAVKLLQLSYQPDAVHLITDLSCDEYVVFSSALKVFQSPANIQSLQKTALSLVSKDFFKSITSVEIQNELFSELLDSYITCQNSETASMINHCLKKIPLESETIILELGKFYDVNIKVKKFVEAKKARRSVANDKAPDSLSEDQENRLLVILEMLQAKKKINNVAALIPSLFHLLYRSFTLQMDNVDYIKLLILSCINHCCKKLPDDQPLSEKEFNIEMVIDCMRMSKSPQTQQQALILLTHIAEKYPEFVLHSIMKVFTFMGENIIRKDDNYSFQIIRNTVQSIIPIIIESDKEKKGNAKVSSVIQVFIDALPDIPEHRRGPLFINLMSMLQPVEEYLWMTLVLLFGHIVDKHQSSHSQPVTTPQSIIAVKEMDNEYSQFMNDFGLLLCTTYAPKCQILTCERIIVYLTSLPDQHDPKKRFKKSSNDSFELFDLSGHSDKQLRHLKFVAVTFVSQLLSHSSFIHQVAENEVDVEVFERLLEVTLLYVKSVSNSVIAFSSDSTLKFWKALMNKTYDVLDKVNGLLPSQMFVSVIANLMGNPVPSIRRKSMEMLNSKLQHQIDFFSVDEIPVLIGLVPKLVDIVSASKENTDVAINRQTALSSLRLLARVVGFNHKNEFVGVLNAILAISKEDLHFIVKAANFLCLAEVIVCLGPHVLGSLPDIVAILNDALENFQSDNRFEPVLLSALVTLHKLLEHLANFLSPYLKLLIPLVSHLSARYCYVEDSEKGSRSNVSVRIHAIQTLVSDSVPPRILLPAIKECYGKILATNIKSIRSLMSMLSERIKTMEKVDISDNLNLLECFFLDAFEFRKKHSHKSVCEVTEFEGHIIDAYTCLVLKLSETSFRPFFFKLYNWATQVSDEKEISITFYRLTERIAETLKGLFMLFAGNLVKHTAAMLTENSIEESEVQVNDEDSAESVKTTLLLQYVLDTLYKCFLYDQEGFMNKERFDTLLNPLVDQLENFVGGAKAYEERLKNHLCPCIAQFAVAAGEDLCWKQLNYQILLKTRHSSPKVRFYALQCTLEVCKRLGDDFTSLLPETIPFLAELMEDESFDVEQQCHSVISEMETILGEPLQSYFQS